MPVNRYKTVSQLLICGLLPVFNLQAENMSSVNQPSMDFLEYLGGIETEIDGRLSSPLELDLEAAVIASNSGEQQSNKEQMNNDMQDSEAGNEESIDE